MFPVYLISDIHCKVRIRGLPEGRRGQRPHRRRRRLRQRPGFGVGEADVPADPSQVREGAVPQRRRVQGGLEPIQLRLLEGKDGIYCDHTICHNM